MNKPRHNPWRCLLPKLSPAQVRDLGLAHIVNLDAISHGSGNEATLWQWVGGTLTWWRVATLLDLGIDEMAVQVRVVDAVVSRFKRTGRVGFSGSEYQLAKRGVEVMDELARRVDRATALQAADWSEAHITQLTAEPQPASEREAA